MGKKSSQFRWSRYLINIAWVLVGASIAIAIGTNLLSRNGVTAVWPGGFMILCGCLGLVTTLAKARSLVVAWRIEDQRLICRCLGRIWPVQLSPEDVTTFLKWESKGRELGYKLEASGFPELWFDNGYLADAAELAQLLSSRKPIERNGLSGSVDEQEQLLSPFGRAILIFFFGCPLVVGIVMIGIGLIPPRQLGQQYIFLAAGIALTLACGTMIFFIMRGLSPGVVRVHVTGSDIQWWRFAWPFASVRNCSEVVEVVCRQPSHRRVGAPSERFQIRFADGATLELDEATLSNARSLADMIRGRAPNLKSTDHGTHLVPASRTLAPVDCQPSADLSPYLEDGECLLWAGRAVPEKLGGENGAPGLFGGMLMLFSVVAGVACVLAISTWPAASLALPPLLLFFMAGVFVVTFRGGQYRRLLKTQYAVTTRRAIVIGGLGWADQPVTPLREIYSLSPDEIRDYRIERQARDIVLTSEWHVVRSGRRSRREVYVQIGFIAVNDCAGALDALQRLLRQRTATPPPTVRAANVSARAMRDGGISG
jgi:hypothetical protein